MTTPHRLHLSIVLFVVAVACALAPVAEPKTNSARRCVAAATSGTNRPDLAAQVVTLVNHYRESRGLHELRVSPSLTASSTWKSLDMAARHYFAHDDPAPPVTRSAYRRARDCGFSGNGWGENIAWGYPTAHAAFNGWLNSPGHRANILGAAFTTTGVGVARSHGGLYWTQSFGSG